MCSFNNTMMLPISTTLMVVSDMDISMSLVRMS